MQNQRPIAYFSKGLTDREQLKPVYERELMAIVMAVQKWKHYLMGRRFTIFTDQKSLKFLLDQRDVSMDYQKWLTKLLGYDFEIIYKAGVDNKVADGLSRIHLGPSFTWMELFMALTKTSNLDIQDVLDEIDVDEHIQKLLKEVVLEKFTKPGYTVKRGRLFYKDRLVLPKGSKYIPVILEEYHSGISGGHSGVLKTVKRVQRLFHWTNLKQDVQTFVAECRVCQTHKTSTLTPAGLLQPIPVPNQIWEELSMDFIGGLPKSQGVDVICVVVDRLSKYAHFLPLKHPYTAHSVAEKFVKEIVRLHGFPVSIISDRDRVFLSSFWRECFKLAGTKLKFSTAYHAQTYRQTELVNRCLESYLRCFTSSHPKQWSQFLSWAEFWYNSSFHTCLKATPFELVYGRKPPSLIRFEEGSASNFELESMLKERDAMLEDIKIHLSRAQDLMKNNADKHRRDLQLDVGSLVFLKLRPYRQTSVSKRFCQKLAAKFYGPFKVIERVGAVAYRLELPASSKIHPVFHISQLKPVLGKDHEVIPLPASLTDAEELVLFRKNC